MFTNIPPPTSSPWTDVYNQTWVWNGEVWVRTTDVTDSVPELSKEAVGQFYRRNALWSPVEKEYVYYGASDTPPINRPNGATSEKGDGYFNTTLKKQFVWTGHNWQPYGQEDSISDITSFYWKAHPALVAGDVLPVIDDLGNVLPPFLNKGIQGVALSVNGNIYNEFLDESVPAEYSVNYATGEIFALSAWEAGDILLQVITTAHRVAHLHPYTESIRNRGPGFIITGGNFSSESQVVIADSTSSIATLDVESDFSIHFTLAFSVPDTAPIQVRNGANRMSFGSDLTMLLLGAS